LSDRQRSDNREESAGLALRACLPGRRNEGSPVTAAEVDVQLRSFTRKQRGFRVTRYLSQRIKGK
jgi:hypothetical protein